MFVVTVFCMSTECVVWPPKLLPNVIEKMPIDTPTDELLFQLLVVDMVEPVTVPAP